ncbi:MAG: GntR family transcriptional regulator [Eubacterium sp.]|nr:GntR family transcriptional regulator [Eubacterium sp.]
MAVPKYEMIKNDLIQKIKSGIYAPGEELPSETEMLEQYKVSRITVRRAIDELYLMDYIEKKQGKRAIVKLTTRTQNLNSISSYTEEILKHGMTPSRKILSSGLRLPTSQEQKALLLDKTEPVFFLERIVYADETPFCYTISSVVYKYFRDIESYDFSSCSLYNVIEEDYQIKITTSELKLKATLPNDQIASYLHVDKSLPMLKYSATTYGILNNQEVPIEYFMTYYLTDLFEYTLIQKRS